MDQNRIKKLFIKNRKEDLRIISWDGLLNHQLLPEEGGLGILQPFEQLQERANKGLRVTTL